MLADTVRVYEKSGALTRTCTSETRKEPAEQSVDFHSNLEMKQFSAQQLAVIKSMADKPRLVVRGHAYSNDIEAQVYIWSPPVATEQQAAENEAAEQVRQMYDRQGRQCESSQFCFHGNENLRASA